MKKILGLITKDLLLLKSYKKNFIISMLIYLFVIISNIKEPSFSMIGTLLIIYTFSLYAQSTFNSDEKSDADSFYLTLPINKSDIVLEKYLFHFLAIILGTIFSFIIMFALYFFKVVIMFDIKDYLILLSCIIYIFSLLQSLQLPFIFKMGAEKGRLFNYVVMIIIFSITGLLSFVFADINFSFSILKFVPFILIGLIIFNYYLSYKISCSFYNKREF